MKVPKKLDYSEEFYLAEYRIKIKEVKQSCSKTDQLQTVVLTTYKLRELRQFI